MSYKPSESWWKEVGSRLREVREKSLKTSQREIGAQFGLGQDAISEIERGLRRQLTPEVERLIKTHLGVVPQMKLAPLPDPDAGAPAIGHGDDAPELQRAIRLVRQLYRLKTQRPPYRAHDWNVLMALLEAPEQRE